MKGVSPIISHSTYLLIGIIALSMMLITVYRYSDNIEDRYLQIQGDDVIEAVKLKLWTLVEISKESSYVPDNEETLASIKLDLPEKINGNRYTISLENSSIAVEIKGANGLITSTESFDYAEISGLSEMPAYLRLVRYPDGSDKILLVR